MPAADVRPRHHVAPVAVPRARHDVEGLGYVPTDDSMSVADETATVVEIDPDDRRVQEQLRGGNAGTVDFMTATQVGTTRIPARPSTDDPR